MLITDDCSIKREIGQYDDDDAFLYIISYVMGFKQGRSLTKSNKQEANVGLLSPKAMLPREDPHPTLSHTDPQKPMHPPEYH